MYSIIIYSIHITHMKMYTVYVPPVYTYTSSVDGEIFLFKCIFVSIYGILYFIE